MIQTTEMDSVVITVGPEASLEMPTPSDAASATNDTTGIHRSPMADTAILVVPFMVVLNVIFLRPGMRDSRELKHALTKVHHRMLLAIVANQMGS